ncbi:restriction endonuclease [Catenuloplanes japonicus]|uniref:restriction endonuclease n=1 Tax=Catenuloplanes japonicus TaxID=33876 RepID=UPI000526948E|nr:restriction endonuclease [Catenuloplanes japonicus]
MTVFDLFPCVSPLQRYELSITRMLCSLDGGAEVTLNRRVPGVLSGTLRRVDLLARGHVFGTGVTVVVECCQGRRAADIGAVDRFIGKLLDVDADRGVLYSRSGFTPCARARAAAARYPAVMAVSLAPRIPRQRSSSGPLPPHGAEEITEADFALFLWPG